MNLKMVELNRVFLAGNLTTDPELRYVPSGTPVANFRIAVNRNYIDPQGERKRETCFITVVTWRKLAELVAQYLHKGSAVLVEGYLRSRDWEDTSGAKKSTIEVRALRVQFLDKKETVELSEETKEAPLNNVPEEEIAPSGETNKKDDLPF
jgi:single-strand DNA-binding protein